MIYSDKTLLNTFKFDVVDRTVTPDHGDKFNRQVVISKDAAAIVPVFRKDGLMHVILVEQDRPALGDRCIEIPAGTLDIAGESPLDCAIRELQEETGYIALPANTKFLCAIRPTVGFVSEKIYIFLADQIVLGDQPPIEEGIKIHVVAMSQALDWVRVGVIQDSKTVAGLLYATHFS